jgi:hypothetical protein
MLPVDLKTAMLQMGFEEQAETQSITLEPAVELSLAPVVSLLTSTPFMSL